MSHAILVAVVIVLCLAAFGIVTYDLAAVFWPDDHLKLRVRLRTARPDGPPPTPAPGAARCTCGHTRAGHHPSGRCSACDCPCGKTPARRTGEVPIADTGAMHAIRDELLARNGVRLQDRPRHTVDVVVCDPAVTPIVPGYYQAWEQGRWLP